MKYSHFIIIVMTAWTIACKSPDKQTAENTTLPDSVGVSLELKWTTDSLLTTCESVIYDQDHDILYVSNINGIPDSKDGNGFISKVSLDGKVVDQQWIKGLNAPKGMGLHHGKLYVTDIDKIVEIDIAAGKIINSYPVNGAKFLNDITVDKTGKVYASDSQAGNVVLLDGGKVTVWLDSLDGPNGLLAEGDTFLMAGWNSKTLNIIDAATHEVIMKTDSLENPDGIEAIGDGSYLVSGWNGTVHYVDADWKKTLILDTRADSASAADIEYIREKNLLLVPTFFKNKVAAYELKK